jgi:hypothetical protein
MNLPRYSIASILAVISIIAVALAALRSPSYLWANVTTSLVLRGFAGALSGRLHLAECDTAHAAAAGALRATTDDRSRRPVTGSCRFYP